MPLLGYRTRAVGAQAAFISVCQPRGYAGSSLSSPILTEPDFAATPAPKPNTSNVESALPGKLPGSLI